MAGDSNRRRKPFCSSPRLFLRLLQVSSINRILRKLHLDHGPMCVEFSGHGVAEQGECRRRGPPSRGQETRLIRVTCADHRIFEELGRRNALEAAGGGRDARHRNRTAFSREQSAALEQGARQRAVSKQKESISELTDPPPNTPLSPPNQNSLTATTLTPTPERSWQPRSASRRTPSR